MNTQYDMIYADSRSMHVIHQSSSSHPHACVKLQPGSYWEISTKRSLSGQAQEFSKELRIIDSQVMDPWEGRKRFLFWKTTMEPKKPEFSKTHGPSCNGLRDFHWSYLVVYRTADVETFPFCACHVGAAIYRRFHPVGEIQFEGLKRPNEMIQQGWILTVNRKNNFIHPWISTRFFLGTVNDQHRANRQRH